MAGVTPAQVFIFVNPSSGGNRAAVYLQDFGQHPLQIRESGVNADLWIYNIRKGDSGKKEGFLQVKALSDTAAGDGDGAAVVRVMVAGGDGTVMWALSELAKTAVDMAKVAVGHIPFGTANDFSRTTGWGPTARANLIGENREYLTQDVRRWINAEVKDFDLWEVDIVTAPDGKFFFVHDGKKALTADDKLQHGLEDLPGGGMRMRKPMVNYFSFGFSERAGVGFEKMRTKNRLLNNMRYGWEGAKKWLFRRPPNVSDVLEELSIGPDAVASSESAGSTAAPESVGTASRADCVPTGSEAEPPQRAEEPQPLEERPRAEERPQAEGLQREAAPESAPAPRPAPPRPGPAPTPPPPPSSPVDDSPQVLLKSSPSAITLDTMAKGVPRFRGTSANLLFINIPSFAGGADPWSWSSKLAVEGGTHASAELLKQRQDFGDGKLELLSYTSGLSIGIDAVNSKARVPGRGGGCRIASDHGPFSAHFKPPSAAKYKSAEGRVYFQIDGEFFVATLPKVAVVRHFRTVRVLASDEPRVGARCC